MLVNYSQISITLPKDVAQVLRSKKENECMNISAYITQLLQCALSAELKGEEEQHVL